MVRDDYIIPIPQPKDRPYRYMPNPTLIPPSSGRIEHFLGIADVYLSLGMPPTFVVEPDLSKAYKPDAYVKTEKGAIAVIEYQRSRISNTKMQEKLDQFVDAFKKKEHSVKTVIIYAYKPYDVKVPEGFQLLQKLIP